MLNEAMHSCLNLIDYTWRESDESECTSPKDKTENLGRRFGRNQARFQRAVTLSTYELRNRGKTNHPWRTSVCNAEPGINETPRGVRRTRTSSELYPPRQVPTYASRARMHRPEFASVWYPIGHCRYKLCRDSETGIIQWGPETSSTVCVPRTLAEICIANLIRDWPCIRPSTQKLQTICIPLTGKNTEQICSALDPSIQENCPPLTDFRSLPLSILEKMLTEAIIQRDCTAISGLVANWPGSKLNVYRLLPKEDFPLSRRYLTKQIIIPQYPGSMDQLSHVYVKGSSLADAFIIGLLSRQPSCQLEDVDFCGFEEDRKMCIELLRLPLLWMSPERRCSEEVRQQIRGCLQLTISDQVFDRYFAKIATIYSNHDADFYHGQKFNAVTIRLDCNISVDEVAFGLALQSLTPFRFSCNRLLMQRLPNFRFPVFNLIRLLDPLTVTQFELEDPELGNGMAGVLPSALGWIISLRNLRACALPACIPPPPVPLRPEMAGGSLSISANMSASACRLLNRSLLSLRHLQRLSLARCYLNGQLHTLLGGLSQPIEYLNVQDCCLSLPDIDFLVYSWRPLRGLYELNLARNNLGFVPEATLAQLLWQTCFSQFGHLTCLSLADTCLSFDQLIWILKFLSGETKAKGVMTTAPGTGDQASDDSDTENSASECCLRVLCIQNFVPPTPEIGHRLLHSAILIHRLRLLQLYPAFYAFPGGDEQEQRRNRVRELQRSKVYLQRRGRHSLEVL